MIFLISVSTAWRGRTQQRSCWICRHFAPDNTHHITGAKSCTLCTPAPGKVPPSCYARPFCRLKAPLGLSLLRYASKTRTFENALFSAACKKKQGKLWQKERGLDGASPLDRSGYAGFCFMPAHPPGVKAAMPEGTSSPARRCS